MAINWTQVGEVNFQAWTNEVGLLSAGQNDDGSFYWSCGEVGKVSAPICTYAGVKNPSAYVAAAVERCKADAEAAYAKLTA